jgi:hypothetical protein
MFETAAVDYSKIKNNLHGLLIHPAYIPVRRF